MNIFKYPTHVYTVDGEAAGVEVRLSVLAYEKD